MMDRPPPPPPYTGPPPEGWQHDPAGYLERRYTFDSFSKAVAALVQVALLAERHDHHPDWQGGYDWLNIRLTTHESGRVVTERDMALAAAIDRAVVPMAKADF